MNENSKELLDREQETWVVKEVARVATESFLSLIIGVIILFLSPYVMTLMWGWFITGFGLPALGYWHAFGVMLVVDFLTYKAPSTSEGSFQQIKHTLYYVLLTWLASFIISLLM